MQPHYYINNPTINPGPDQTPNHIQDPGSIYPPGKNGEVYITNSFKAWCAPTSAACQLGHLNYNYIPQLQTPIEINDGFNANQIPISLETISWDSNKGWGDYLLDGPINRLQISDLGYNGYPSDIGYYMNTNNVGINGISANSAVGTLLTNIYKGLNTFYNKFGYQNIVGQMYSNTNQISIIGMLPEYWSNNNIQTNSAANNDETFVFDTIKYEIDNNRTVLGSFKYWNLNLLQIKTINLEENEIGYYELSTPIGAMN